MQLVQWMAGQPESAQGAAASLPIKFTQESLDASEPLAKSQLHPGSAVPKNHEQDQKKHPVKSEQLPWLSQPKDMNNHADSVQLRVHEDSGKSPLCCR